MDTESMLQVGTTLANGKYRIDQYLASGGFGNTYAATDTAFDEKVAIKELFVKGICGRSSQSTDVSVSLPGNQIAFTAHQDKFRKEARRLRKLSNKHIVHVHDLFDENQTTYYVMDYIEGESLDVRLKRTKVPMKETDLMFILPQILDALQCLHSENIWHLDLKPGNIMIDAKGYIQLIDFGASKQVKSADGKDLSTSTSLAYTAGFAPSEQMERKFEKLGPWTDLYALGATMFNLLTHKAPPYPSDIGENASKALQLPDDVSQKTKDLIAWLMTPNRLMRPQSVSAVKEYLTEEPKPERKPERKPEPTPEPGQDPSLVHDTVPKKKENENGNVNWNGDGKEKKSPDIKKIVAGVAIIACLGGGFFTYRSCNPSQPQKAQVANTTTTETVDAIDSLIDVTDKLIKVTSGPDNMRVYKYTGVIENAEGALPNTQGIAKFDKYGNVPASTYKGTFVDGVCDDNTGNATMTFSTGDKYIGTFVDGYYGKGTYTLADGSRFEGAFKEGSPYNGKWYNSDGSFSANVVNGEEQ